MKMFIAAAGLLNIVQIFGLSLRSENVNISENENIKKKYLLRHDADRGVYREELPTQRYQMREKPISPVSIDKFDVELEMLRIDEFNDSLSDESAFQFDQDDDDDDIESAGI